VGQERYIQGFGWEPEGKRPFGRPRFRWEDKLKSLSLLQGIQTGCASNLSFYPVQTNGSFCCG